MPNYCENDLALYGDPAEVKKVLEFIAGVDPTDQSQVVFDFNKVIPYPEQFKAQDDRAAAFHAELRSIPRDDLERENKAAAVYAKYNTHPEEFMKDGYNSGGYEWCLANWGTKWNACHPTIEARAEDAWDAVFHFDTAWAPPTPVIAKLAEMFPAVEFTHEYFECGMAFCGSSRYSDGKCKQQAQGDYYGTRGG